jgi:arsenate reductase
MAEFTIYHNPRCSKSRQTLALLTEQGVTPDINLYLETAPAAGEINQLLGQLGIGARDLLRKGEAVYKEAGLADTSLSEAQLVAAMAAHPQLIERPIVVRGARAVLGRPPENVLDLLD